MALSPSEMRFHLTAESMSESFLFFKERWRELKKVSKGVWWMPRLTEAMKDVISCDKLRVGANNL